MAYVPNTQYILRHVYEKRFTWRQGYLRSHSARTAGGTTMAAGEGGTDSLKQFVSQWHEQNARITSYHCLTEYLDGGWIRLLSYDVDPLHMTPWLILYTRPLVYM
jgi:hypothetical protein